MRFAATSALALAILRNTALGQAAQGATVRLPISVHDFAGAPILGAKLRFENHATHDIANALTDATGAATVQLRAGPYCLTVMSPGFGPFAKENFEIHGDNPVPLLVRLEVHGSTHSASLPGLSIEAGPSLETEAAPAISGSIESHAMETLAVPQRSLTAHAGRMRKRIKARS